MTVPQNTALLVIDVQKAFDDPKWGRRNNPAAEANVARLLKGWRETGRPVIHIRHRNASSGRLFSPGEPGFEVKPEAASEDAEPILYKRVNSAFIGTGLEQLLREQAIEDVVLCGITTDHCVSTTTRMAGNLDFNAVIVSDATATFDRVGPDGRHWSAEDMHDTALASLNAEFAQVRTTDEVLAAL
ncbi:MAG: cysteine hydrolase [Actinomycetota bacterium]|nr:cysteine hydrolase [Actinomycetota bacterium]